MEPIIIIAIALVVAGPIAAAVVWLVTRRRLALGVFVVIAVLDVLWWIDLWLIVRDYRDLDGFIDCYPYCSPEQKVAGVVIGYTPLVMAAVLVGSLAVIAVRLWRARPGSRSWSGNRPSCCFEKMTSPSASTSNWPLPPSSISASCSVSAFNSAARLAARAS